MQSDAHKLLHAGLWAQRYLDFLSGQHFHLSLLSDGEAVGQDFGSGGDGHFEMISVLLDLRHTLDVFAFLNQIIRKTWNSMEVMSNAIHEILNAIHKIVNAIHKIVNAIHKIVNAIHEILNAIHETLNAMHATLNAMHKILNAIHKIDNAMHATLNVMHATLNALHEILNAIHEILNAMYATARYISSSFRSSTHHIHAFILDLYSPTAFMNSMNPSWLSSWYFPLKDMVTGECRVTPESLRDAFISSNTQMKNH